MNDVNGTITANTIHGRISSGSLQATLNNASSINLGNVNIPIETVTKNYELLNNKPSINGVELINDVSFETLGREDITNLRLKQIIDLQYEQIFG